jgi:hypothetical protein
MVVQGNNVESACKYYGGNMNYLHPVDVYINDLYVFVVFILFVLGCVILYTFWSDRPRERKSEFIGFSHEPPPNCGDTGQRLGMGICSDLYDEPGVPESPDRSDRKSSPTYSEIIGIAKDDIPRGCLCVFDIRKSTVRIHDPRHG